MNPVLAGTRFLCLSFFESSSDLKPVPLLFSCFLNDVPNVIHNMTFLTVKGASLESKLDLQSAGSSPNLTYLKSSARDAIRIL